MTCYNATSLTVGKWPCRSAPFVHQRMLIKLRPGVSLLRVAIALRSRSRLSRASAGSSRIPCLRLSDYNQEFSRERIESSGDLAAEPDYTILFTPLYEFIL